VAHPGVRSAVTDDESQVPPRSGQYRGALPPVKENRPAIDQASAVARAGSLLNRCRSVMLSGAWGSSCDRKLCLVPEPGAQLAARTGGSGYDAVCVITSSGVARIFL
jgi:hypothetical protein